MREPLEYIKKAIICALSRVIKTLKQKWKIVLYTILIILFVVFYHCLYYLFYALIIKHNVYSLESIRYMISALIQSQASVLAIVISLMFIVVQVASKRYSYNLLKIFIEDNFFSFVLVLHFFSIFIGVTTLYFVIDNANKNLLFILFYNYLFLALACGICLVLYIDHLIDLFKPDIIIEHIFNAELNPRKLEKYTNNGESFSLTHIKELFEYIARNKDQILLKEIVEKLHRLLEKITSSKSIGSILKSLDVLITLYYDFSNIALRHKMYKIVYDCINGFDLMVEKLFEKGVKISNKYNEIFSKLINIDKLVLGEIKKLDRIYGNDLVYMLDIETISDIKKLSIVSIYIMEKFLEKEISSECIVEPVYLKYFEDLINNTYEFCNTIFKKYRYLIDDPLRFELGNPPIVLEICKERLVLIRESLEKLLMIGQKYNKDEIVREINRLYTNLIVYLKEQN